MASTSNARIKSNQIEYFRVKSRCAIDLYIFGGVDRYVNFSFFLLQRIVDISCNAMQWFNIVYILIWEAEASGSKKRNPECAHKLHAKLIMFICVVRTIILDTSPISKRLNMFWVFFWFAVFFFIHSFHSSIFNRYRHWFAFVWHGNIILGHRSICM